MEDEVKQVQTRKARQFYAMLNGTGCRAAAVRRYFGEEGVEACGQCDLCLAPPHAHDASLAAQKALSAVHRLGGRFGRGRLVDHLLGKTKEPSDFEAGLSTFGIGREFSPAGWRDLVEQLIFEGLLKEDPNDNRPLIGLGDAEAVRAVYRGERKVAVRQAPEPLDSATRSGRPRRKSRDAAPAVPPHDQPLFEALRAWRAAEAKRQHVPPYVIFHDRTLAEIAVRKPARLEALAAVSGVGQAKIDRYGAAVTDLVATFDS